MTHPFINMTSTMFKDAKRFAEKKFSKIQYKNTKLPADYESTTKEYRKVRDELVVFQNVIKSLATYEFGGTIMKNFSHWANSISETSNIKYLKRDDIFTDMCFVGRELSNNSSDSSVRKTAVAFADTYESIGDYKRKMNKDLEDIIEELKLFMKKSKNIDCDRKDVENTRFDLEKLLQSDSYDEGKREELTNKFTRVSESAEKEMKEFIGTTVVNQIILKVTKIHKEFCDACVEKLARVE